MEGEKIAENIQTYQFSPDSRFIYIGTSEGFKSFPTNIENENYDTKLRGK